MSRLLLAGVAVLLGLATLAACEDEPEPRSVPPAAAAEQVLVPAPASPVPGPATSPTEPPASAPVTPTAPAPETRRAPRAQSLTSDGRPRTAWLTIPTLGLQDLPVRPHRGRPDDARGTRIQDRGIAASPYGTGGLVGPGGVGNYLITGHRTSSTRAFARLPQLRTGAKVHVETEDHRYTYRIVETRITSFRSAHSLRKQSAAVPGHPNARPSRAMITLSTCRTPEDRAEGNHWSDEFGNPEHRIDKIGVLVAAAPKS